MTTTGIEKAAGMTEAAGMAQASWLATEYVRVGGLPIAVLDRAATADMMCEAAKGRPRSNHLL